MRAFLQRTLFVLLTLLAARGDGLHAQWKIVAPNVVAPNPQGNQGYGAMTFKDGILWAGFYNLAYSTDTGRNWTTTSLRIDQINDISFLNRDSGIIASTSGTLQTIDGGNSWTSILGLGYGFRIIYASSTVLFQNNEGYDFYSSLDGGRTWRRANLGFPTGNSFALGADGTILLLAGSVPNSSPALNDVLISKDSGTIWTQEPGLVQYDSWSIDMDSCQTNLYVESEDYFDPESPDDSTSTLYSSSDGGETWIIGFAHHVPYLTGAFSESKNAQFALALNDGVLRSTDHGMTWINIGGPPGCVVDSRTICAVNDNILFVLDSAGNVWGTFNSGGDSILSSKPFFASPYTLFQMDTVRCDSITRSTVFTRLGCDPPIAMSSKIVGPDSASFTVSNFSDDSIQVTLHGTQQGSKHALMILSIDNGSSDTITLAGFVNIPPDNLTLSTTELFGTDSISCDTITRSLIYNNGGCSALSVASSSIIGADSASFKANNLSSDSISVALYGIKQGNQHALLLLNLNNGSSDTVSLAGYVNLIPSAITLSTQNVQTDVVGGTVSVPITLVNLERPENVNLILHYDTILQYQGSFNAANVKLDIPNEQWPGHSELNIPQAQSGVIAGYARFTVFADSVAKPQVTFDSLDVLSAVSPCEYTLPAPATSIITPPYGCGTTILSQFIEDSDRLILSIRPNPTMGDVELTSSLDLGNAEVEIYDVLGVKRADLWVTLSKDAPAQFSLPDGAGIYYIRINSTVGVRSMSGVVAK